MKRFEARKARLEGVWIIQPFVMEDERGTFIKDYSQEFLRQAGIEHELKEVFYTVSHSGVIRALHFQRVRQQPKLVRAVSGKIFDVVVDIRPESPTLGQWESFELNDENHLEILIPAGFAHGYLVLEDSIVSYKCAELFYAEYDDGIQWNDVDIGIPWPLYRIDGGLILSQKDRTLQSFQDYCIAAGRRDA